MPRRRTLPIALALTAGLMAPVAVLPVGSAAAVGYAPVPGVTAGPGPSAPTAIPVSTGPVEDAASLPVTGTDLGLVVGAGVILLLAGAALRVTAGRGPRAR
jgi:hypothetical protein